MAAADASVKHARDAGYSVETIIALDNATDKTQAWFGQSRFDHWTRMSFAQGDLGRVRNEIVPMTKGRFIAFLDADDLFSQTWLKSAADCLVAAQERGDRVIAHPELNWSFDGAHSVYFKPDQDDPLFTPLHFYSTNYYDSLCMTPREAQLAHPYVSREIPMGLSFQDWQFSIETMESGWRHCNVRNTIIFKRSRDESLVNESRARRAIVRQLDAMAIDRVCDLRAKSLSANGPKAVAHPKTAPIETPHCGAAFEARVRRAKQKRGNVPERLQDAYDAIKPLFDHAFYLAAYPDILALEDMDPAAHYVRAGARENRDPAPWFNGESYRARHPELANAPGENPFYHWIKNGKPKNEIPPVCYGFDELADCLGLTASQALQEWEARRTDLISRLMHGELGQEVNRAGLIEPLVEQGWPAALSLTVPPFHRKDITSRTVAMWRLIMAAGKTRAQHVICVNRARFGTAPRIEGHIARALAQGVDAADIMVVTTDKPGAMPDGKLPAGVRVVDFADLVPDLVGDNRQRVLVEFLRAVQPTSVINVNSRLLWDAMRPYGRALSAATDIYAVLLCNERNSMGYWSGYPLKRVYRYFDVLAGIFTDSDFLRDDLIDRYAIRPEDTARIVTLPNPVDASLSMMSNTPLSSRPQVFWAGRLDEQKRVDLLFAIAAAMPDVDFKVWGDEVMTTTALPPAPDNILREGTYSDFSALPFQDAQAWLYTSAWDGVPTMLLEVAMTGLPIVASNVGGVNEVLIDGLASLMEPDAPIADWVTAIKAVFADQAGSRAAARQLRERLVSTRTTQSYEDTLWSALGSKKNTPSSA